MKKILMLAISLFGLPLAHAEILNNAPAIGNFVSGSAGSETVIPFWTETTGTTGIVNAGTVRFNVFTYNTNTKLFSTPVKAFSDPREACSSNFSGTENKFVKTTRAVAIGQTMNCKVLSGGIPTGAELNYSFVYLSDIATNKAWIFTTKTESLVGLDVIPDQNGNGAEEIAISLYSTSLRVMVVDSITGGIISNKAYSMGTPPQ